MNSVELPSDRESTHPAVQRVTAALRAHGHTEGITWLESSARTAREAAQALNVDVGQIASSLVFTRPCEPGSSSDFAPVLVITSGRHRVDTLKVAQHLDLSDLGRADADFVRRWSGFAIGGVAPLAWLPDPSLGADAASRVTVVVDSALADYRVVWAAAGHPHTVFPSTHDWLVAVTGGISMSVGD